MSEDVKTVILGTAWLSFYSYCTIIFPTLVFILVLMWSSMIPHYEKNTFAMATWYVPDSLTSPIAHDAIYRSYIYFIWICSPFIGLGLLYRKLWAWKMNWLLIFHPTIIFIFGLHLIFFSLFLWEPFTGPAKRIVLSSSLYMLILITLCWTWPNFVYFRKRRQLFS